MLKDWIDKLAGWKFHGIAAGFILLTLVEKVGGIDIPDFDPGENWLMTIFGVTGLMAVRSTVKSVTGK